MRKHLYLYFSNLNQLRALKDDAGFEPVPEYYHREQPLTYQNEFGRIKTAQNYYHILVGRLKQEGCPWCGYPAEVIKLGKSSALDFATYCVQCMNCGSRGPVLYISESVEQKKDAFDEYMSLLWRRYNYRRAWDEGFVNPYESPDISQADQKKNSEK